MRSFVIASAVLAMFATAARAADDGPAASPVAGKLPDTASTLSVYLFMLKKNNISLPMDPQEFCRKMDYGEAVLGHRLRMKSGRARKWFQGNSIG